MNLQPDEKGGQQLAEAKTGGPVESSDEARRMEAVRDLLFGRQVEDLQKEISAMAERLGEEMIRGRRAIERKIESLESYTRDEIAAVREAMSREESERGRNEGEARGRLEALESDLAAKSRRTADDVARVEKTMHERFLRQSKRFTEKLDEASEELRGDLGREAGELRDSKVDRAAIGDLLMEVAMRLHGDGAAAAPGERAAAGEASETLAN